MNWLKDFYLCIILGRIKVVYIEGTVRYFTVAEWFQECQRVRSVTAQSKKGLPFVKVENEKTDSIS